MYDNSALTLGSYLEKEQVHKVTFEWSMFTVTTSRSFGEGIKLLGIESLIATRTPPPLEFLSLLYIE